MPEDTVNIPASTVVTDAPSAADTTTAPAVAEVVTTPPVIETSPVVSVVPAATPETPAAPETVLGEALDKTAPVKEETKTPVVAKAPEVKKEDKTSTDVVKPVTDETKPVPGEENKVQEGQSAEPAPPPTYDAFTVPEGVTLDQERMSKFTEILSDLELTGKVPHEFAQQFGQKAVDFHVEELKNAVSAVENLYKTTWERQKTEWKDTFLKDPGIGGNRFQTTVDSARNFIRTHGGNAEQQTEFRNLMETSGLGNHPAVIRLLANAGQAMEEGKPLAAQKPLAPPKSKTATLYGKSA